MKVLVTGALGQLGYDVMNELAIREYEGIGTDIVQQYSDPEKGTVVTVSPYIFLDITDRSAVERVIREAAPDAVIHCAAWTSVDLAEDIQNIGKVHAINVKGTENIAKSCRKMGCKMVYLSTDYVFDGKGSKPWSPDYRKFEPLNIYGKTKLEGEQAVSRNLDKFFIVRTAWVFGVNGQNFVKAMLHAGREKDTVRVVNDQIGTPTYAYDLARLLVDMIETEKYGYYHATNEGGYISWYDFAHEIFEQAGYMTRVISVTTDEYSLNKAMRPYNSRLDNSKLVTAGFKPLPEWQDALSRYLKRIRYQD